MNHRHLIQRTGLGQRHRAHSSTPHTLSSLVRVTVLSRSTSTSAQILTPVERSTDNMKNLQKSTLTRGPKYRAITDNSSLKVRAELPTHRRPILPIRGMVLYNERHLHRSTSTAPKSRRPPLCTPLMRSRLLLVWQIVFLSLYPRVTRKVSVRMVIGIRPLQRVLTVNSQARTTISTTARANEETLSLTPFLLRMVKRAHFVRATASRTVTMEEDFLTIGPRQTNLITIKNQPLSLSHKISHRPTIPPVLLPRKSLRNRLVNQLILPTRTTVRIQRLQRDRSRIKHSHRRQLKKFLFRHWLPNRLQLRLKTILPSLLCRARLRPALKQTLRLNRYRVKHIMCLQLHNSSWRQVRLEAKLEITQLIRVAMEQKFRHLTLRIQSRP